MESKNRGPHPVDAHAGSRLKKRRDLIGLSQDALGASLGLTFQQIQKYEKGVNRFGMGRAYEMALILDVDPMYFLDEVSPTIDQKIRDAIRSRQAKAGIRYSVTDCTRNRVAVLQGDAARIAESYISLPSDYAREQVKGFFQLIQNK